jgi:hypothetical protein
LEGELSAVRFSGWLSVGWARRRGALRREIRMENFMRFVLLEGEKKRPELLLHKVVMPQVAAVEG